MARMSSGTDREQRTDRGQLVLVAAIVVAIALLVVFSVYVQLAYVDDIRAATDARSPDGAVVDATERAVVAAAADRQDELPWDERETVATTVGDDLDARLDGVETARTDRVVVYRIERNRTASTEHAERSCPDGPGRAFGPCEAVDGVVLQERAGRTHVVAIAVDVRVVMPEGTTEVTHLIDAEVGKRS